MLYALVREVRKHFAGRLPSHHNRFDRAVAALTPADRKHVSLVDGPGWRTILTAPYRRRGLDRDDPRILLGFELSVHALETIATRCRAQGIQALVVLLPTKESVFWPRITNPDAHPQLAELVADEAALRERLLQRLERAGVDVVDVLSELRTANTQPYHESADGHLNPAGHVIVADRVAAWVLKRVPIARSGNTTRTGAPH
jgi:hypothetical protein